MNLLRLSQASGHTWFAAAAFLVVTSASCTHRAAQSSYSSPPKEVDCPSFIVPSGATRVSVRLRFNVKTDGSVDPASVTWIPIGGGRQPTEREIEEAKTLAAACMFVPASRGVEYIAADFQRTFRVVR